MKAEKNIRSFVHDRQVWRLRPLWTKKNEKRREIWTTTHKKKGNDYTGGGGHNIAAHWLCVTFNTHRHQDITIRVGGWFFGWGVAGLS
jgi:hypothetical protein